MVQDNADYAYEQIHQSEDQARLATNKLNNVHTDTCLAVIKTNNSESFYPYYAVRSQPKYMIKALNKVRRKYPDMEIVFRRANIPNCMSVCTRLRDAQIIKAHHNYFSTKLSIDELVYSLNTVCDMNSIGDLRPLSNFGFGSQW